MRLHEPIRVAVVFGPGAKLRPVWFDWKSRRYDVLETTFSWSAMKGAHRQLMFAVRGSGGLFELTYDTNSQAWELTRVEEG